MRARTWFLPLAGLVSACGGSASEPASFPSTPSTAAASPSTAAPKLDTNYRLAFKKPVRWTRGIAVAPWGDPVVVVEDEVQVLDRSTGRTLESKKPSCRPIAHAALASLGDARLAAVCDQGVSEITTPGLASKTAFQIEAGKGHILAAAFNGGRVALAVETPEVRTDSVVVVDTKSWAVVDTVEVQGNVTDVTLSADGTLLGFGGPLQGVAMRDLAKKSTKVLAEGDGSSVVHALAFAPNGQDLFSTRSGEPESFRVADKTRTALTSLKTVDRAMYVSPTVIATFGEAGLRLIEGGQPIAQVASIQGTHDAINASADAGYICALTDEDASCFSTKPMEPSTYKPSPSNATNPSAHDPMSDSLASAPANTGPKKPPPVQVAGTVTGLQANTVTLSLSNAGPLKVGGKGALFAHPGGSDWLEIGRFTVKEIKGNRVTVELSDDPNMVEVDGRQINPYKNGSSIKVELEQK